MISSANIITRDLDLPSDKIKGEALASIWQTRMSSGLRSSSRKGPKTMRLRAKAISSSTGMSSTMWRSS